MRPLNSALYLGRVGHTRLKPRRHTLSYRSFMLLADLDELSTLDRRLRWFSLGRFNLFSLRPGDHGDGSDTPLRVQVAAHLAEAGVTEPLGPVRLLCLPRVAGYAFNPLCVYFCHGQDGRLLALLYEVNSTFGERHTYLIPVEGEGRPISQRADKRLHVSPFMDMGLTYDFHVDPPGERVRIAIDVSDAEGQVLAASFVGRRATLSDAALLKTFFAYPLQTLAVTAAIHWEALKLLAKGLRLRPGPPAPAKPVSHGRSV